MFKSVSFFILIAAVLVKADDLENMKQKYAQLIMDCAKDYPIEQSDIKMLKNRQMPDKESVKCLFACAYKKSLIMTDDGYLSVDGTNKLVETYFGSNPEKLKKAQEFTDACKAVNDEDVSDGGKGCERASLIFKCSIERAEEFGFLF